MIDDIGEAATSIEAIFNERLEQLLEERSLTYQDLLELLEEAGYTPDFPATVLLNDAAAMASVLGVSLYQLLLPLDGEAVDITPSIAAGRHDLSLWLRGLRPLRDEDRAAFNRQVPSEDLEPNTVAEQAVWSERNRVAGLTAALSEAVDSMNRAQVKHFMALAGHALDEVALRGADAHRIDTRELEASVRRGNRFLRQNLAR